LPLFKNKKRKKAKQKAQKMTFCKKKLKKTDFLFLDDKVKTRRRRKITNNSKI